MVVDPVGVRACGVFEFVFLRGKVFSVSSDRRHSCDPSPLVLLVCESRLLCEAATHD